MNNPTLLSLLDVSFATNSLCFYLKSRIHYCQHLLSSLTVSSLNIQDFTWPHGRLGSRVACLLCSFLLLMLSESESKRERERPAPLCLYLQGSGNIYSWDWNFRLKLHHLPASVSKHHHGFCLATQHSLLVWAACGSLRAFQPMNVAFLGRLPWFWLRCEDEVLACSLQPAAAAFTLILTGSVQLLITIVCLVCLFWANRDQGDRADRTQPVISRHARTRQPSVLRGCVHILRCTAHA